MADTTALFSAIEQKYGLPPGYLTRTYQIESNSGQDVYNAKSKAAGGFQFIPRTAKQYGLTNPYDLPSSADAAARLAADNRTALQKVGVQDPTGAHLYLAHQQGAGGAAKLLNGSEAPAAKIVGANAVGWNGGQDGVTGSKFASQIMAKFDRNPDGGLGILSDQFNAAPSAVGFPQPGAGGLLAQGATMPSHIDMGPQASLNTTPSAFSTFTQPQVQQAVANYSDANAANADPKKRFDFAGLAAMGGQLMAAGAPKQSWTPGAPAPVHRPELQNLFAGLLGGY
jgi:hypothetical protein